MKAEASTGVPGLIMSDAAEGDHSIFVREFSRPAWGRGVDEGVCGMATSPSPSFLGESMSDENREGRAW